MAAARLCSACALIILVGVSSVILAEGTRPSGVVSVGSETHADTGFLVVEFELSEKGGLKAKLASVAFRAAPQAEVEHALYQPGADERVGKLRLRGIRRDGGSYEIVAWRSYCMQDQCWYGPVHGPPFVQPPFDDRSRDRLDVRIGGFPMLPDTITLQLVTGEDVLFELQRTAAAQRFAFGYAGPSCSILKRLIHERGEGALTWTPSAQAQRTWIRLRSPDSKSVGWGDAGDPRAVAVPRRPREQRWEVEYTDAFHFTHVMLQLNLAAAGRSACGK